MGISLLPVAVPAGLVKFKYGKHMRLMEKFINPLLLIL